MKKALLWAACVAVVFVMALPVSAQSGRPAVLKGEVNFAFVSGGRTLPAGEYTIEIGDKGIRFLDAKERVVQVMFANPQQENRNEERPRLVFRHYGDQYFLGQIWTRDHSVDFPKSRTEYHLQVSLRTEENTLTIAMR